MKIKTILQGIAQGGSSRNTTGLTLSGGAIKGFAHIGVYKALKELNIKIDAIAGTSAGALAGVFMADGFEPEEIYEILYKPKLFDYINLKISSEGLLNTNGIKKLLEDNLRSETFDQLKTPLHICATDFYKGKVKYFDQGKLIECVLASLSIPVIFPPYKINGAYYVDGGVMDNFPVKPLQEKKMDTIIGINLLPTGEITEIKGLLNTALRSFYLSFSSANQQLIKQADILIEPKELAEINMWEIEKAKDAFDMGYREGREVLQNLSKKPGSGIYKKTEK